MKKSYWLLSVFAVAMLLLVACQQPGAAIPNDPVEALLLINDKQAEVKTAHFDATLAATVNVEGDDPSLAFLNDLKISGEASGDVDTAGQLQLAGSLDLGPLTAFLSNGADKIDFEIRVVGDKLYVKGLGQDWTEQSGGGNFNFGSEGQNPVDPATVRKLFQSAVKVERLGNEGIDGADSYHFKATLDPNALLDLASTAPEANMTAEQLAQAKQLLANSQFDIELWAGSQDLFMRQEKIHLLLDLSDLSALAAQAGGEVPQVQSFKLDLTFTFKLSKQNQPVTITAP